MRLEHFRMNLEKLQSGGMQDKKYFLGMGDEIAGNSDFCLHEKV